MKAIIFDLDETLVDRTSSIISFLEDQFDRFDSNLSCSKDEFVRTVNKSQGHGYVPWDVAYSNSIRELGIPESLGLYDDFREKFGSDYQLFPKAAETLEILASSFILALITNGNTQVQNKKIDSCGIRKWFSSIKISEDEKIKKPNKEIYLRCLADLELKPEECIFVGDHPVCDVFVPKELGMKGIWLRKSHFNEPTDSDYIINSVAELPQILQTYNKPNKSIQLG